MATMAINEAGNHEVMTADQIEIGDQTRLDVRRMWAAMYRNRLMILAVVTACLIVGLLITVFTTPIYEATSTIQVEPRSAQTIKTNTEVDPQVSGSSDAQRYQATAVDIIKSRALAEKVAEDLKLYTSNTFFESMHANEPAAQPGKLAGVSDARKRAVLGLLMSSLIVKASQESSLISLSIDCPDPRLAADIANSYARNAVSYNLEQKYQTTAYARKFLEDELANSKARLEQSERAAISYARAAGLLDLNITKAPDGSNVNSTSQSLVSNNLLAINSALSEATATRIAAQQRYLAANTTAPMSLPEVQNNGTIQSLIRDRAALQASYAEMGQRRQESFPEMRQNKAQMNAIDQQIRQISVSVIGTLKENYLFAQRSEDKLREQLGSLRSDALTEQERSVSYNLLRREADTNRSLYDVLLQRYREVSTVAGVIAANIVMLDSAQVPSSPIQPRAMINLMLAAVVGLALAILLVYLRETFDDAIRSPEEVEEKLNTQLLGTIPKLHEGKIPMEELDIRNSALTEAYLALRSVLAFATSEGLPQVMMCTSSLPSEGKSTTSLALARGFAAIGKKTLLIDGDLRKPTVHFVLGLPREPGFSDVIVDAVKAEEAIRDSGRPNLDVLTCGTMPPNPAELFGGDHAATTINRLAELYDVIIIDGPPVMGLADAPLLSSIADGTLLVVEAGRGYRGQAKLAIRRLRANSARIIGAVLTKFDPHQSGYGDAYEYSYSYAYSYGQDSKEPPKGFWPWSKRR